MKEKTETPRKPGLATRGKLLAAATDLMRRHGYSATTVDRICEEAGVTKGAFFHYFKSKEELGAAAVEDWCRKRAAIYFRDMGDPNGDPLGCIRRWIEGLIESVRDPDEKPVCLLGMISQETAGANERMRELCEANLKGWTGFAAQLLAAAKKVHRPKVDFDPEEVGWMLNGIWQGSLLIAKTLRDREVVVNNLRRARAYVDALFEGTPVR